MNTDNTPEDEPIVLPDECGDTLWDAVLQQEVKVFAISTPMPPPLQRVRKVN